MRLATVFFSPQIDQWSAGTESRGIAVNLNDRPQMSQSLVGPYKLTSDKTAALRRGIGHERRLILYWNTSPLVPERRGCVECVECFTAPHVAEYRNVEGEASWTGGTREGSCWESHVVDRSAQRETCCPPECASETFEMWHASSSVPLESQCGSRDERDRGNIVD